MISLIVAQANHRVIGNKNDLPWYLPADLKHFKNITSGHTVIMGRKTYESIYNRLGGPLPNRTNIVISRSKADFPDGFEAYRSLQDALTNLDNDREIFIIGGAQIYRESLDQRLVDKIYLTKIDYDIEGDTFFPELEKSEWREVSFQNYSKDTLNPYNYKFIILERSIDE